MRFPQLLPPLRSLRFSRFERAFALTFLLGLLGGCAGDAPTRQFGVSGTDRAATVASHLSGWFTSEAQSIADPSYFNIHLVAVPIWAERSDGHWLYVEQAAAGSLDQPYRQRIYHVTAAGDDVRSEIFSLPDPQLWIAAWEHPHYFARIGPSDLEVREGCAVALREDSPERFVGSTEVGTCISTRQGAAYATSEVVLEADRLASWDRGFDAAGVQVWGATEGAYIFDRKSRRPRKKTETQD